MSRRWLLSLFCLAVPLLLFVQFVGARGPLRVNEAETRVTFQKDHLEVRLAIDNLSGELLNSRVRIELLDPKNNIAARGELVTRIERDTRILALPVTFSLSQPPAPNQSQLLWYRMHYQISPEQATETTAVEGFVSLSKISPELFELRVAMSDIAREGARYHARVQAVHPTTRKPANDVAVTGEITLEDDDDKSTRLLATGLTDASGYAVLLSERW